MAQPSASGRPTAVADGPRRTIRLLLEYDGSAYCGWQIQPNGPSIQGTLEAAVQGLTGETVRVEGSGRTDSGVHAAGQVAHLQTCATLGGGQFARALNAYLPVDISVRESAEVHGDFHARFSATGKIYQYCIENAPTRPALGVGQLWWVSWPLWLDRLAAAAATIVGTHDFTSFADGERHGEENVRTVRRAVWERHQRRLVFTIEGEGFLYKMVRTLVGTMVEIGRGRLATDAMAGILQARRRSAAGPTAPPQGLTLLQVLYEGEEG